MAKEADLAQRHVLGYLWKAGKALKKLLEGKACQGCAARRPGGVSPERPGKAVDDCADYLLDHKGYLRHHEYLRDGLPIASGVVEGACRSLVQDRMDLTGARLGLPGGEAVLELRSLRASGDLDDYLEFHRRWELERNHL